MNDLTSPDASCLAPALNHSRYLERLFNHHPQLREETARRIDQPFSRAEMLAYFPANVGSDDALKKCLRHLRQA